MSENSLINQSYIELPLFKQAFIHKSVSSNHNNERLEFLGDAVLEVVVSGIFIIVLVPWMRVN